MNPDRNGEDSELSIASSCSMPPKPAPARAKDLSGVSEQERHARTVARIKRIQAHLTTAPRTERLKGLVCIITGAGSLKGIGCASLCTLVYRVLINDSLGGLLRCYLLITVHGISMP